MPIRTYGMPNVLLEAMAMEVPIAATAVGEVPHLLEQGRSGVLLADQEAFWAPTIKHLLTDAPMRKALATAGLRRVRSDFRFADRMAQEFSLYDQLLGHPSSARSAAQTTGDDASTISPISPAARRAA